MSQKKTVILRTYQWLLRKAANYSHSPPPDEEMTRWEKIQDIPYQFMLSMGLFLVFKIPRWLWYREKQPQCNKSPSSGFRFKSGRRGSE